MHDTLRFISKDPIHRRYHHHDLTFGLLYAFTENFILPLSHDEVVHGKGSLLGKMPGDRWQRFANLRAYYGFMWGASRQEAPLHGRRVRPGARVEPRRTASTGTSSTTRSTAASRTSSAISTAPIAICRRCTSAIARGRLPVARRRRRRQQRDRLGPLRRGPGRVTIVVSQLHAGAARGLSPRRAAARLLPRGRQHRRRRLRRLECRQSWAAGGG